MDYLTLAIQLYELLDSFDPYKLRDNSEGAKEDDIAKIASELQVKPATIVAFLEDIISESEDDSILSSAKFILSQVKKLEREALQQKLDEAMNSVLSEYYSERGIENGDISSMQCLHWDDLTEEIAGLFQDLADITARIQSRT